MQPSRNDGSSLSVPLLQDDDVEMDEAEHHHQIGLGPTLAGIAGNVLEWYDFALFGYFGDVIGDVFFPANQPGHMAIVESFAVFGGAFLMRPIGGMVMGYIGDKDGNRKLALTSSIFLMAFPTFLMGCLPSYNMVGIFAIIALIVVRLFQGLSVGGQLMSSLVFTLENHPKKYWGFYGSVVMASANFGTLLGGIAGFTIRALLNDQQVHVWGWRVPFLMGIFVSVSGFYLRSYSDQINRTHHHHQQQQEQQEQQQQHLYNDEPTAGTSTDAAADVTTATTTTTMAISAETTIMTETNISNSNSLDSQAQHDNYNNPLYMALGASNRRSLLAASMVPMLWSGGFYLSFVWMPIYMTDLIDTPIKGSFAVNSSALLISVCFFFCYAGHLSDLYGRKIIMTIGGVGIGIFSPILIRIIGNYSQGNPWIALIAQICLGLLLTLFGSPMMAWLTESFHPKARLTSVAIGYNIAQAVGGGLSPSLATVLVDRYGVNSPGYIITTLSILSLIGLWVVAPPQRQWQDQQGQQEQRQYRLIEEAEEAEEALQPNIVNNDDQELYDAPNMTNNKNQQSSSALNAGNTNT